MHNRSFAFTRGFPLAFCQPHPFHHWVSTSPCELPTNCMRHFSHENWDIVTRWNVREIQIFKKRAPHFDRNLQRSFGISRRRFHLFFLLLYLDTNFFYIVFFLVNFSKSLPYVFRLHLTPCDAYILYIPKKHYIKINKNIPLILRHDHKIHSVNIFSKLASHLSRMLLPYFFSHHSTFNPEATP